MGANLKPIAQQDFSGGENLVVSPYLISQKQSERLENQVLDEHGSLRTRDGVADLTTGTDVVNPILLRGNLVKVNGQEFPFAVQASSGSGSAVAADITTTKTFSSVSSTTQSLTLGATAKILVVTIVLKNETSSVDTVKFDGVSLTRLGSADSRLEMWALVNPTVSAAKTLKITFPGSTSGGLMARSFTVATGWRTVSTATGTSTTPSLTIASATNDMVIDSVAQYDATTALTEGAGQTEQYDLTAGTDHRAGGSREAGAASVTMSWTLASSTEWAHMAVSLTDTSNKIYKTDDDPWTTVGTLSTAEPIPDWVPMKNNAIFINGYETPRSWDGITLAVITAGAGQTVPPGAKHGMFHLGALWLWNTAASDTALDGPSSLRASSTNDYGDWPNTNQTFVSNGDGQVGMGMVPFTIVETGIAPTATLVLFKNYRGFQVTGVFGASTFSIQPIKSDMGCIAPRTIQFVSGFGAIRLTHKGFALYNGVEDRLISEEVRPLIFSDVGESGIDFTNVIGSWATQSQNPPLYICACPEAGTGLTRLFIYDLIRRGWTHCTLPNPISCMNLIFSRLQEPTIHLGRTTGGVIQRFFTGDEADNGESIDWRTVTRSFFAVNQMEPVYWRRAQVNVAGPPNSVVTVIPIVDGEEREPREFVLADSSGTFIEDVISPDIKETAHTIQLDISGSGPHRIRGIEFQAVAKPLTKYRRIGGRTS